MPLTGSRHLHCVTHPPTRAACPPRSPGEMYTTPGTMGTMGTPYAKGSAHSSTDVTSPPDAGERPEASPYTSAMARFPYVSAAADTMSTTTDKSAEDEAAEAYAEDDEAGEGDDKAARR